MITRLLFVILAVLSTGAFADTSSTSVNDLLQQAWQAEHNQRLDQALTAYTSADSLRPGDLQINLKIAQILFEMEKPAAAAPRLVKTLDLLQKDPGAPLDLKIAVCSALMGCRPAEWRGGSWKDTLYPAPYTTLPESEKQRLSKSLPESWLFPSKWNEMSFRFATGETDRAFGIAKEIAVSGNWESASSLGVDGSVPASRLKELAKSWSADAKKAGNPYLWMAALKLHARSGGAAEVRSAFPEVLKLVKADPALLCALGDICRGIAWKDGEAAVRALPGGTPVKSGLDQLYANLQSAVEAGDRTKAAQALRGVAADYPDRLDEAFGRASVRKMMQLGWNDLLVQYIRPEVLAELGWTATADLIVGSIYNQPRFDYWVQLLLGGDKADDNFCAFLVSAVEREDPERAAWVMEQSLKLSPDNMRLRTALINSYLKAGYADRALGILRQLMQESKADSGANVVHWLGCIWVVGNRLKNLDELTAGLWNLRESYSAGVCRTVAAHWLQLGKPQDAQKWIDQSLVSAAKSPQRSSVSPGEDYGLEQAYALRLQVLLKLDRKDDAKKLLAEAQKQCPKCQFFERVSGLSTIAEIDWNGEIQRQVDFLKRQTGPSSEKLPCTAFAQLAMALVKAGKADQAATVAAEAIPAHKNWQDGLVLAVKAYRDGVAGIVPLIDWLKSSFSADVCFGSTGSTGLAQELGQILAPSRDFYSAFAYAVILTAPEQRKYVNSVGSLLYAPPPSEQDMAVIGKILGVRQLSRTGLFQIGGRFARPMSPNAPGAPRSFIDLCANQNWCATGPALAVVCGASTASEQELGAWLDSLASQKDWEGVDPELFLAPVLNMQKRQMNALATRFLEIVMPHIPEGGRGLYTKLLADVSGKQPTEPVGDDAKKSGLWLAYAQSRQMLKQDGVREAATKALELAGTSEERWGAINILRDLDPAPLDMLARELPSFEKDGDPKYLQYMLGTFYSLAHKDHSLAGRVAPLIDRCLSADYDTDRYCTAAVVHLWANDVDKGVALLLPADLFTRYGQLGTAFKFVVRDDIPPAAQAAIGTALDKRMKSSDVSLTKIAEALRYATLTSPEGGKALASIVLSRLEAAQGLIPNSLLDSSLYSLHDTVHRVPYKQAVVDAWCPVVEAVFKKACQQPDAAKTFTETLSQWLERCRVEPFCSSENYKKLKALAEGK